MPQSQAAAHPRHEEEEETKQEKMIKHLKDTKISLFFPKRGSRNVKRTKKLELMRDFIHIPLICKFQEDPSKQNELCWRSVFVIKIGYVQTPDRTGSGSITGSDRIGPGFLCYGHCFFDILFFMHSWKRFTAYKTIFTSHLHSNIKKTDQT